MQKISSTFALIFIAFISISTAQMNWDIKGFSGIDVSGNIEIRLEKGAMEKVLVSPPNREISDLDIYVDSDGILKIKALKSLVLDRPSIKIKITYLQLSSIKAQAGAEITSNNTIHTDDLWIKAGSGAQIELSVEANILEAKVSEGGELELKGMVNSQYASAATGGEYDGLDLACAQTHAHATTGGEVMVNACESLSAKANTGGVIKYLGDARIQSMQTGLSGKVKKLGNKGMRIEWNKEN